MHAVGPNPLKTEQVKERVVQESPHDLFELSKVKELRLPKFPCFTLQTQADKPRRPNFSPPPPPTVDSHGMYVGHLWLRRLSWGGGGGFAGQKIGMQHPTVASCWHKLLRCRCQI